MSLKTIGIIPARWRSTRLAGKVLAKIAGKPMIQHVWEQASQCQRVAEILIACDDQRVFDAALNFGAKPIMTSAEHASGTDRIAEVARQVEADILINIQGDEPLIQPDIIDSLALVLEESPGIPMATVIKRIIHPEDLTNPNIVKVVLSHDQCALYFSRAAIPFDRTGETDISKSNYYKHLGIYAYTKEFLLNFHALPNSFLEETEKLEQLRVLEAGYKIKTVETGHDTISVDTQADLEKVELFLKKKKAVEVQ